MGGPVALGGLSIKFLGEAVGEFKGSNEAGLSVQASGIITPKLARLLCNWLGSPAMRKKAEDSSLESSAFYLHFIS